MLLLQVIAYFITSVAIGLPFWYHVHDSKGLVLWQWALTAQLFLVVNILLIIKVIQYGIHGIL